MSAQGILIWAQVVDIVVHIIPHDEDAAGGVFRFGAAVEADAGALRYILHDGQQSLETWRLRDC